ncbi:MAG TPA: phosphatase PAP2 family protein [Gaiellales bacterium]|nr:phosphatase PAP2 family protein [Gaiellales bacterium]
MESLDRFGVETLSGLDWPLVTPLMKFLSATHDLIPLAIAVILAVRCRRLAPVVMTVLAIALGDRLDYLLKSWIGRPRPSLVDPHVHPLIAVPSDSSMPSGHALTAFACAAVLAPFAPRLRPWLYVYAGLVALSRPYLGVHYPSDVIAGALVGLSLGLLLNAALRFLHAQVRARRDRDGGQQGDEDAVRQRDADAGAGHVATGLGDHAEENEQDRNAAGHDRDLPGRHR